MSQLSSLLALFEQTEGLQSLTGIRHGVEREALRILDNGHLSEKSHPKVLGSALCNDYVTTDYAEVLMEFITQPHDSIDKVLDELYQIQHFVVQHIDQEMLWPFSMPCYVKDENKVELAQYGSSNIGKMKTVYREGLRNRYGTMMQLIAGVHFNFSLPDEFWALWHRQSETTLSLQDFRSEKYMGLIRNYKRMVWMIPYLFGASPSLCGSFLQGRETDLPFESLGNGTIYLPYATSLRMSDLGYTNSEQSALHICYNDLPTYVEGLRRAIKTPSQNFAHIGTVVDGQYRQLNSNILQIENEFYSSIRPKQVAKSGEMPTTALEERGISYVEVRALDINPFEITGISKNSFYFLDSFLLYCLFTDSPELTSDQEVYADANLNKVVTEGRKPGLVLQTCDGSEKELRSWMLEAFEGIQQCANVLDQAYQNKAYSEAVATEKDKVFDPDRTPSAQLLNQLKRDNIDNGDFAVKLAKQYKEQLMNSEVEHLSCFEQHVQQSLEQQQAIEDADTQNFDEFLTEYFSK